MSEQNQIPIQKIVQEDDPRLLVEQARKLADQLRGDDATKTQVRKLYGVMKQIELNWPLKVETDEDKQALNDAYRSLVLFKPRLAYQASRHPKLRPLAVVLQQGIDFVGKRRRRLQRLSQFFEATLAFYVAAPRNRSSHNQKGRKKGGQR